LAPVREEVYFAGVESTTISATPEDEQRRAQARARRADATPTNLGTQAGHPRRIDLASRRPGARAPADRPPRARPHNRGLIAFGGGWTDPERQCPVGDRRRHEPRHVRAIVEAELHRAFADPDPLRGIARLAAR
jgi:hypothetical protein